VVLPVYSQEPQNMNLPLKPLHVDSLKEACVKRLEELILSGELKVGVRLPSERDFAASLGVSRPVLHEALVDLSAKGLVSILARRGVMVNDYRQSGSMAMLSTLLTYHNGKFDPQLTSSLFCHAHLGRKRNCPLERSFHHHRTDGLLEQFIRLEASLDRNDLAAPGQTGL